jgi:cytochrome c oxidase subunit 4
MSAGTVLRCWLALMVLLALTTGLAFAPLGAATLFVSLTIAAAKALLVLLLFMELKAGNALVRTFAAAGFFWLLIMIAVTAADYTHRTDVRVPLDKPAG